MGITLSRFKPEKWHPRPPGDRTLNVETLADFEMPVETRVILHRKVSRYAARFCLSADTELELESLFFLHISEPIGNPDACWTEKDLCRFYSDIPTSYFPKLPLSCSVLYRLLLHLGSFPYVTQPEPCLTYTVFRLGLIMLSGRYTESQGNHNYGDQTSPKVIRGKYRRLIFQALAETTDGVYSSKSFEERADNDDEDLIDALAFLDGSQQWEGPDACIGYHPAPLPGPRSLPSSLSTCLNGQVEWDELEDFLKALFELKIRGILIMVDQPPDLSVAVNSIIAAIDDSMPGSSRSKAIDWSSFDTLFDLLIPRALEALPQIVDPFFKGQDQRVHVPHLDSSTSRNAHRHPKSLVQLVPSLKNNNSLLTLPVLAQILCCIDVELGASHRHKLRTARFVSSGSLSSLRKAVKEFPHKQNPKEFILLLSGSSEKNEDKSLTQEVLYAVVSLDNCHDPYKTRDLEKAPFGVIVQLAPIFRQYSPSQPLSANTPTFVSSMEFSEDTEYPYEFEVRNGLDDYAELILKEEHSTYAKMSWKWGDRERREERVKIDTIELMLI